MILGVQAKREFFAGTIEHNVDFPFTILDLGCSPARDLKTITGRGHVAVGLKLLLDLLSWHSPTVFTAHHL